jgi:hypothetical protein
MCDDACVGVNWNVFHLEYNKFKDLLLCKYAGYWVMVPVFIIWKRGVIFIFCIRNYNSDKTHMNQLFCAYSQSGFFFDIYVEKLTSFIWLVFNNSKDYYIFNLSRKS